MEEHKRNDTKLAVCEKRCKDVNSQSLSAVFVACMEDALEVYSRRTYIQDSEYVRNGTCSIYIIFTSIVAHVVL